MVFLFFGCKGGYGEKDQSVGEIVRVVLPKSLNFPIKSYRARLVRIQSAGSF